MEATILLWISSLWLSTCTNLSNAHYVVISNPTGFVDLIRAHQFIEVFKIILRAAKRERNGHLIRFMWEKCKVRNSFAMAFNGSIKGSVSFRLYNGQFLHMNILIGRSSLVIYQIHQRYTREDEAARALLELNGSAS